MSKKFLLIALLGLCAALQAADEIHFNKGEKIKQANGLTGIANGKDWIIPAEYDRLTALNYALIAGYKGKAVDLYSNSENKTLFAKNLTPAQADLFVQFTRTDMQLLYTGGRWGFKSKYNKVLEPVYDSLTLFAEGTGYLYVKGVGIWKEGKMGFAQSDAVIQIQPGPYVSFEVDLPKKAITYNGKEINQVFIARRTDGGADYYYPTYMGTLAVQFPASVYTGGKGDEEQMNNWWKGLRVFRNAQGRLGLITADNKLLVPPVINRITIFSAEIHAWPGHNNGLELTGGMRTVTEVKDTALLINLYAFTPSAGTELTLYPCCTQNEYALYHVKPGYDYHRPQLSDYTCNLCDHGVITVTTTTVETKQLSAEKRITETHKLVWGELNDKGQFEKYTTETVIPAQVEKRIKTEEHKAVCDVCHGYVNYREGTVWNEQQGLFEHVFIPGSSSGK